MIPRVFFEGIHPRKGAVWHRGSAWVHVGARAQWVYRELSDNEFRIFPSVRREKLGGGSDYICFPAIPSQSHLEHR